MKQTDLSFPIPRLPAAAAAPLPVPPAPVSVVEYGTRRTVIVAGVMMAALLQTLDATIVNVALPTIEGNIGASIDEGTWIITAYIIANVVAIPLAPFFLQRFGRRNYYAACVIGFTVASFLCGTASSLDQLVLYRVVQGAFGGGLVATGQSILRDTFPPEQLGVSQGIFALGAIMGPALGPPLGGLLVDNFNWNWVFDINIVPGVAAFIILAAVLRDPAPAQRHSLDLPGLVFLVVGIGSLQYVLSEGERWDWFADSTILAAAVVSLPRVAPRYTPCIQLNAWNTSGTTRDRRPPKTIADTGTPAGECGRA